MHGELYNVKEEQKLGAWLNMNYGDSKVYENDHTMKFISIRIYQDHTKDPMLCYVHTVAPI